MHFRLATCAWLADVPLTVSAGVSVCPMLRPAQDSVPTARRVKPLAHEPPAMHEPHSELLGRAVHKFASPALWGICLTLWLPAGTACGAVLPASVWHDINNTFPNLKTHYNPAGRGT